MELIRGLHGLQPLHRVCVGTIGAFDGVHLGHQTLLHSLMQKGRERDLPVVVICFEPLPREFFAPVAAPPRLMSFREKLVALRELGVDRVLRINFNERFRAISADAFIESVFVHGLGIKYVVVGDDLRFGAGRKGNSVSLRAAGEQYRARNMFVHRAQHAKPRPATRPCEADTTPAKQTRHARARPPVARANRLRR